MRKYTDEELAFVYENRRLPRRELAATFSDRFERCVTYDQMKSLCFRYGWGNGRDGRFKPGHIVRRKNKAVANCTSFKKGTAPHNTRALGDTRIDNEGYEETKVGHPNRWKRTSIIVWEKQNGEIPDGFVVVFKDGNKTNITIENLECISRDELFERNKLSRICGYNIETRNALARLIHKSRTIKQDLHK